MTHVQNDALYEIHAVEYDDSLKLAFLHLSFLFWMLFGLLGLKAIEKAQLSINRMLGSVSSPMDQDLHMMFFVITLYVWLPLVDVSHLFVWFRSGISDGEPSAIWPYYRRLIERNGLANFLTDSDVVLIDESEYGQLYKKILRHGEEPLLLVCVTDATVGPSGVASRYFLRVPPYIRTAKEAVAWTFGLAPRAYRPAIQT